MVASLVLIDFPGLQPVGPSCQTVDRYDTLRAMFFQNDDVGYPLGNYGVLSPLGDNYLGGMAITGLTFDWDGRRPFARISDDLGPPRLLTEARAAAAGFGTSCLGPVRTFLAAAERQQSVLPVFSARPL